MIESGTVPPISYEENYDIIARTHLESLRGGGGNPWMPPEDITHFARMTSEMVEKYTDPGGKVLDAGCGPGELELELDCERFQVTGLDLSQDYLIFARERVPNVEFVHGNIEAMPFGDETFDTVVICDVLEHVLHLDYAVAEMLRVLKSGGHLIVRSPVEDRIGQYVLANPYYYVHLRRLDDADLVLLFTRSFGCNVPEIAWCPRAGGGDPPDIHCVARKP